jgi:hypothetical protein
MLRLLSCLGWLDSKEGTFDLGLKVFDDGGFSFRCYRWSFVLFIKGAFTVFFDYSLRFMQE